MQTRYATCEDMGTVADTGYYWGPEGMRWLAMVGASDGVSAKVCATRDEAADTVTRWLRVAPRHKWEPFGTVREVVEVR